jgi:hypothetical protein
MIKKKVIKAIEEARTRIKKGEFLKEDKARNKLGL